MSPRFGIRTWASQLSPPRSPAKNAIDLLPMHQVVPRHHPERQLHALGPALAVQARPVALLRCECPPQSEIGRAQTPQLGQREVERCLDVAEHRGPAVLIVALE